MLVFFRFMIVVQVGRDEYFALILTQNIPAT